jgi:hypothetical protein
MNGRDLFVIPTLYRRPGARNQMKSYMTPEKALPPAVPLTRSGGVRRVSRATRPRVVHLDGQQASMDIADWPKS